LVILEPILLISDPKLTVMKKQTEMIAYAVSMVLKAALLTATWAGKARKREGQRTSFLTRPYVPVKSEIL